MDTSVVEYSRRSNKINNEFGRFHRFKSQSGQGNKSYYKSIFAKSATFWSKLGGQVWRHDISIIKLQSTWKAVCYTGDHYIGLADSDTFMRKYFHCNSKQDIKKIRSNFQDVYDFNMLHDIFYDRKL